MLQNNPVITKIQKGITNKILAELNQLSQKEKEQYINFWKNFGPVIKEGLYEYNEYHEKLLPLLRFKSSSAKDEWISLDNYIENIDKKQKEIYYFADVDKNKNDLIKSPQLETFIEKNIPVLFMTDAVDEFWLPQIGKYKDKEFKSITKGKLDLKDTTKSEKNSKNYKEINDLINVLKNELKEKIKDVRVSERLTKSPLLLIADESGVDINMEKLMKMHNQKMEDNKKILEINPKHSMIIKLSKSLTKLDHKKIANLIIDQANILDGNIISDPSSYTEILTELFIEN